MYTTFIRKNLDTRLAKIYNFIVRKTYCIAVIAFDIIDVIFSPKNNKVNETFQWDVYFSLNTICRQTHSFFQTRISDRNKRDWLTVVYYYGINKVKLVSILATHKQ